MRRFQHRSSTATVLRLPKPNNGLRCVSTTWPREPLRNRPTSPASILKPSSGPPPNRQCLHQIATGERGGRAQALEREANIIADLPRQYSKPEEYRFYQGDPNNDLQPVRKTS